MTVAQIMPCSKTPITNLNDDFISYILQNMVTSEQHMTPKTIFYIEQISKINMLIHHLHEIL